MGFAPNSSRRKFLLKRINQQLDILNQGADVWNKWREINPRSILQISALRSEIDAIDNIINRINNLNNLIGVNLSEMNLSVGIPEGISFFSKNLSQANFSGANLSRVDFSQANLSQANLSQANLSGVQALETNFVGAILTGACIENWNINNKTELNNVICDYIYLKQNQQERRPHDPNKNFAPGEFTKLFQEALETVDLIFSHGIDWQAFLTTFQKLQIECGGSKLTIQAIEKKSGGAFVVRVQVPPDANKAEIEKFFKRKYGLALKAKEEEYKRLLQAKNKDITYFRQQNTDLMEIIKLQANKPIYISQVQGNNMAGDRNIQIGTGNYVEKVKGNYIQGNYHAAGEKQSLAEAAAEIQELLKQLEKTNPTATDAQKEVFVSAGMTPTKKERLINALKEGGKGAIEEFLDNPYVNVAIKIIEGWKNT
jgi:uncharacterized protein YjbI with pentapeptide repeats